MATPDDFTVNAVEEDVTLNCPATGCWMRIEIDFGLTLAELRAKANKHLVEAHPTAS